jgi:HEPN domain-containing protein
MTTSLDHLPAERQQQLRAVAKIITTVIRPEKIILYGIFAPASPGPDFHILDQFPSVAGNYEILVVTGKNDFRCDHSLQDLVESRCRFVTPVTVLVHDIEYVNRQLSQGQYFFSLFLRNAVLLYDAGSTPLAEAAPPNLIRIRDTAKADYEKWWSRAAAFFKSALFNTQQREWWLAIFLLHQAAEQTYHAILLAFTGYKPCTHNLDKLRRYTSSFSIGLAMLFPRNTPDEDRLFKLLQQGYVDARYKEGYSITEEEVGLLTDRVGKLQSIAANICGNRLLSLGKMAAAA